MKRKGLLANNFNLTVCSAPVKDGHITKPISVSDTGSI